MEDNAGYSRESFLDEVINRRHFDINGKQLQIPRKLLDRIFGERVLDYKRTKIYYKDNGEIWATRCNSYRYKPSALSRAVTHKIQSRVAQDFAEQLQSVRCESSDEVVDSQVDYIVSLEQSSLENRDVFQRRLLRDFYKSAKL